jgi:hypothetical protein
MFVHCCHCRDCQRQAGSAFVVNGLIETDRIEVLSGSLDAVALPTESGRPHDVYRCTTCGTALWSDYGRRPYLRFVRLCTLDVAPAHDPDVHIYTRSKLPWIELPAEARIFAEYYDMHSEWPAEALARRQTASDAFKAAG